MVPMRKTITKCGNESLPGGNGYMWTGFPHLSRRCLFFFRDLFSPKSGWKGARVRALRFLIQVKSGERGAKLFGLLDIDSEETRLLVAGSSSASSSSSIESVIDFNQSLLATISYFFLKKSLNSAVLRMMLIRLKLRKYVKSWQQLKIRNIPKY